LDCAQFKNFATFKLQTNLFPIWTQSYGPCVLTETDAFKQNFRVYWKEHPQYFIHASIARVLFNPFLFNGLGQYSVSELLHRLYKRHGISPWDNAYELFCKEEIMESVLSAPKTMQEELELYSKHFDPVIFGTKQQQQRTDFRLNFLQVYRKRTYRGQPVFCFAMRIDAGSYKTVYTAVVPSPMSSSQTSKSKRKADAKLRVTTENWYYVRGTPLTKNSLGVGFHDWHSRDAQQQLQQCGVPDPHIKVQTSTVNSIYKRPHPRNSKKSKTLKRLKFTTGQSY